MCIHLTFDYQKATQALVFFAEKAGQRINKMKALKLVYFADRYHLRKYGCPITNDEYFAMRLGPVASGVKDLLEMSDFLGAEEKDYVARFLTPGDRLAIAVTRPFEPEVLALTEIEALTFAWETFGGYDEFALSELTHKYPEWKKHEHRLEMASRIRMKFEDFLDDPDDPAIEKCYALSLADKHDTLEELQERSRLEALWD